MERTAVHRHGHVAGTQHDGGEARPHGRGGVADVLVVALPQLAEVVAAPVMWWESLCDCVRGRRGAEGRQGVVGWVEMDILTERAR